MINATPLVPEGISNNRASSQKTVSQQSSSVNPSSGRLDQNKKIKKTKKFDLKIVLGVLVLLLVVVGSIASFILVRTSQDVRQQAWVPDVVDIDEPYPTPLKCYTTDDSCKSLNEQNCELSTSYSTLSACKDNLPEEGCYTTDDDCQSKHPLNCELSTSYLEYDDCAAKITPEGCASNGKTSCDSSSSCWWDIRRNGCYDKQDDYTNCVSNDQCKSDRCDTSPQDETYPLCLPDDYVPPKLLKCSDSYPTATSCQGKMVGAICATGEACSKTTYQSEDDEFKYYLCSCPYGPGPTPTPTGACRQALESCDENNHCCGDLVCQGTGNNRVCHDPGDNDLCPGGSCIGYYSFQCSTLSPSSESNGVPVCQANPQYHGTDRSAAIARATATGCGQWDQVCVGGTNAGHLCGDFAIVNDSCGGGPTPTVTPTSTPTPTPTPTPVVGPQCLNISTSIEDPEIGDNVTFTCAQVDQATRYKFQVVRQVDGQTVETTPLQATGRISEPYTVEQPGTYYAQCQICFKDDQNQEQCHAFEPI